MSRSTIQKWIKAKQVKVNDIASSVHRFLKTGDTVSYEPTSQRSTEQTTDRADQAAPLPALEIIQETPDWLVINKPTGVLVHPDRRSRGPTMVDAILAHAPAVGRVGEDPERPGIVHRLDREVSGLMVVAKTPQAYDSLRRQFARHTTGKTYLALVHGVLPMDEGEIKFRIARASSKARMAARPVHEEAGRAAWTHYRVLRRFVGATYVELEIFSGRTHQIRAHLYALGHPVIGDTLYALRRPQRTLQVSRLLLQSIRLAFDDPASGARQTFELAPDPMFAALIKQLA